MKRLTGWPVALAAFWAGMAQPSGADQRARLDACAADPTHACVLDLLWEQTGRVSAGARTETLLAFIDTALLTGDQALADEFIRRTEWRNPDAISTSRIHAAKARGDRALLLEQADRAIDGRRFDLRALSGLAEGLARVGEVARAKQVATLIPHGPGDSATARNLHRQAMDAISLHDTTPRHAKDWADAQATNNEWWEEADLAYFAETVDALNAGRTTLAIVAPQLQQKYRENGWSYLRALARLAPELTASADAPALFSSYVAGWADPRNDEIAEHVLVIAARSGAAAREAMLAAFDDRQPTPPPRIARMRKLAGTPHAELASEDAAFLGLAGGSSEQKRAAEALATFSAEEFVAQARAGQRMFSLGNVGVLRAALRQATDEAYALAIADVIAEQAEKRSTDSYEHANTLAEWARDTCRPELFARAQRSLARSDDIDIQMWRARFDGNAVDVIEWGVVERDELSSEIADALRGYQPIILKGYCNAS